MPPAVTNAFKNWLKGNLQMKLSSDAAVSRIIAEGVTSFQTLLDFDTKSIQALPGICKEDIPAIAEDQANGIAAEAAVNGANISSISVRRLITAVQAAKYYDAIDRTMDDTNMHYSNVLSKFKIEYECYATLKDLDEPSVPLINDKDSDRKIMKWAPVFMDCMSRTYGARGPLSYVLREDEAVPAEADDPLAQNTDYYGKSGSLHEELIARLPHDGPIFKNDNKSVYLAIEKAARGTSVESTVKTFARKKDGRGAYLALIANHAGDSKYRSIVKRRMNMLQNVKWNGRTHPLEAHVSNHRQAVDDLTECATHINNVVPNMTQQVEYLLDSISCQDAALQAAIGSVRANVNNMRDDFELASTHLIEVDPFRRNQRELAKQSKNANISAIDFNAGRGKTGVDLRWHPKAEFRKLPKEQRDELDAFMETPAGREKMRESRKEFNKKRKADGGKGNGNDKKKRETWKRKMRKALKTSEGTKQIFSILSEHESDMQGVLASATSHVHPLQHVNPLQHVPVPAPVPVPKPPAAISPLSANHVGFTNPLIQGPTPTIGALSNAFPATSTLLNGIMKKPSHS